MNSGRSLLIEEGALPWIIQNANNEVAPIRRHIELALCHLAQHGSLDFILSKSLISRYHGHKSFISNLNPVVICDLISNFLEVNAKEMISGGALWELIRISRDCSREDIRNLARRTLTSSPVFQSEMRRLRIEC